MKQKSVIKALYVCLLTLMLTVSTYMVACNAVAATHYVSPSGSATWANSTNISTPCSLSTAFSNAKAGDLVYLRGGTYNMGTTYLISANAGTGDADANRVIFRAYTGETPDIVTNVSGVSTSDNAGAFNLRQSYWTIDGITMHTTAGSAEFNSCLLIGYTTAPTGIKIINNNLNLVYATNASNIGVIEESGAINTLIQNNTLVGYRWSTTGTVGIQMFSDTGTKILNNIVHTADLGIYQKHPNCDSGLGTAEIAYNYVYDIRRGGLYGRFHYTNVHDNIFAGSDNYGMDFGDDGGQVCSDGYAVINHNTADGWSIKGAGMPNYTVTNNIVYGPGFYYDGSGSYPATTDYNLISNNYSWGTHDIKSTSPTFTGGSSPSTIAGFTLTSGSAGHNSASDGIDRGARVSIVGTGTETGGGSTKPTAPALY